MVLVLRKIYELMSDVRVFTYDFLSACSEICEHINAEKRAQDSSFALKLVPSAVTCRVSVR